MPQWVKVAFLFTLTLKLTHCLTFSHTFSLTAQYTSSWMPQCVDTAVTSPVPGSSSSSRSASRTVLLMQCHSALQLMQACSPCRVLCLSASARLLVWFSEGNQQSKHAGQGKPTVLHIIIRALHQHHYE